MLSNAMISLFLIIFMCIVTREIYSFEHDEPVGTDASFFLRSGFIPFTADEYLSMNRPVRWKSPSFLRNRLAASAQKYVDSIREASNSIDNERSKRFWLFAKKDEHDTPVDLTPHTKTSPNSLTQGLWRSGIVGRRR